MTLSSGARPLPGATQSGAAVAWGASGSGGAHMPTGSSPEMGGDALDLDSQPALEATTIASHSTLPARATLRLGFDGSKGVMMLEKSIPEPAELERGARQVAVAGSRLVSLR